MEALVAAGSDVRAKAFRGGEPLHYAAGNTNAEAAAAAVTALVAAGADVHSAVPDGRQPLHVAVQNHSTSAAAALVKALVAAGADLNGAYVDGRRPLHLVAGRLVPALVLVRLGASLSLRDNAGRTALEAASGGNAAFEAALRRAAKKERHCTGCGAGGERLKRCTRCRAASYCR